jgi:hypothetical protein
MMKTNRRWLKSAIAAADREIILLPWAAKRIARPEKTAPHTAPIIRIFPSSPTKYAAIAAR